jgi:hypothetical protein
MILQDTGPSQALSRARFTAWLGLEQGQGQGHAAGQRLRLLRQKPQEAKSYDNVSHLHTKAFSMQISAPRDKRKILNMKT